PGCLSESNRRTILFNITTDPSHPVKSWKVQIGNSGLKELYKEFSGLNKPPESIEWDGKDNNEIYLVPGKYYYEMLITYQDDTIFKTSQQKALIDNSIPV